MEKQIVVGFTLVYCEKAIHLHFYQHLIRWLAHGAKGYR